MNGSVVSPWTQATVANPHVVRSRTVEDFLKGTEPLTDPVSGEPFGRAYICLETGYTYDLDALDAMAKELRAQNQVFTCPRSNQHLVSLTLYPNHVLWNLAKRDALPLPRVQTPVIIRF